MQFIKKIFSPLIIILDYIQNHFKAMIFLLILFLLFAPTSKKDLNPNNLMQINLTGPIMEVSEVLQKIDNAQNDNNIKGVLFVVDSPGGSVAPSIEIAYAIKRLNNKKPVVVYAKGTLASGSYYASIWAEKIIANPGSMVGSIGVILEGFNFNKIMSKIGVSTQTIQAGKYKKVGTTDRKWKNYEVNELNKVIQSTYSMFVKDVADARGLNIDKKDSYANAHIFTAIQAKDIGLIDDVGVMYNAKIKLIQLSKVTKPVWNKEDKFEKLINKLLATTMINLHTYFPNLILK